MRHDVLQLVGFLYDAVVDTARWNIFLQALAGTLGADSSSLLLYGLDDPLETSIYRRASSRQRATAIVSTTSALISTASGADICAIRAPYCRDRSSVPAAS